MAEFNAGKFSNVRLSDDSRAVTITLVGADDAAMEVTLPVVELPELILYLSRAVARHYADQSGFPVLGYTLPVDEADVVRLSSSAAAGLVLTLREGLRVSFSVPREICAGLAAQFEQAAKA